MLIVGESKPSLEQSMQFRRKKIASGVTSTTPPVIIYRLGGEGGADCWRILVVS